MPLSQLSFHKSTLPTLGVGLSFRGEIAQEIYEHIDKLDFIELILDVAVAGALDSSFVNKAARRVPVVGHGVRGSLGSLEPLDTEYFKTLRQIAENLSCRWFSEHLAFVRAGGVEIDQLMPIQFSASNAKHVAARIREVSALLGLPVLIENIAYYFSLPGDSMSEAEFITTVVDLADCGILLDLNNLYANSLNHGWDPYRFVEQMPSDRVVEIHIAGGQHQGDLYIDTHGHPVGQEVWRLLEYAVATKQPKAVILEREKNFPSIQDLIDEIDKTRVIWHRASPNGGCRLTTDHLEMGVTRPREV